LFLKLANKAKFLVKLEYKRSIRILSVGVKYFVRDLICDVINYYVPSFHMEKIKCTWSNRN